jgi:hypothetical protein
MMVSKKAWLMNLRSDVSVFPAISSKMAASTVSREACSRSLLLQLRPNFRHEVLFAPQQSAVTENLALFHLVQCLVHFVRAFSVDSVVLQYSGEQHEETHSINT